MEVDALELQSGRWHSISGRARSGLTYIWGWVSNIAGICLTVLLSSALANLLENFHKNALYFEWLDRAIAPQKCLRQKNLFPQNNIDFYRTIAATPN